MSPSDPQDLPSAAASPAHDSRGSAEPPRLSIVVPVLDEEPNIAPLVAEIRAALTEVAWELIFIDDGSHDGTFEAIRAVREREGEHIRALRHAARRGKAVAYQNGFAACRGQLVATLDGDLQDDPQDLVALMAAVDAGTDLAIGWKRTGKSSRGTFILSRLFNRGIRAVTGLAVHDMNCPVRVMKAPVAKSLELGTDLHRYIPLLAAHRGHSVQEIPVANRERQHGKSKYGAGKYLESATSFLGTWLWLKLGERPMLWFGSVGALLAGLGFLVCSWVVVHFLAFGADIDDDLPTLVLGVAMLLMGTQFVSLGLLAEILVRRLGRDRTGAPDVVEAL